VCIDEDMWTGLWSISSYIQTGFVGLDSVLQWLKYRGTTFRFYIDFLAEVEKNSFHSLDESCCVADFIYLKCTIFFDMISYSLVVYRRFGGTYYFHLQGSRLNKATKKAQARQSSLCPLTPGSAVC
jgi:hypothetical protein